ncbi:hypothetical protein K501DRAFT_281903 [Backusella circina FSU 941]|nr:hypothetical protein K501DRAFT_281903 [Backusella circina FSU 941]
MTTSSSMSKFRTRNPKASSLGVRSVGKISKRSAAPSKIPKYNKQTVDDEELKRLSFKGTYVTMASRVKSYEKELRPLDNGKVEEGNDNNSRASTPTQSAQTNTPKFKLFKFATSERAKRHKQK